MNDLSREFPQKAGPACLPIERRAEHGVWEPAAASTGLKPMKVLLTFDVEIWCNGWKDMDRVFPARFERYVYGGSKHGQYALPKTLEIMARHGLHGVFFVEPLFSARFGADYLERLVSLIREAGQEVQLHLHAEWANEISHEISANASHKRQHLTQYTLDEQTQLIARAKSLLLAAGSGPLTVFRAGNQAVNRDTFTALRRNGIHIDSSLNVCFDESGVDLREAHDLSAPFVIDGVETYPVAAFRDGFGRLRPAQLGACSAAEMSDALWSAHAHGWKQFVVVSHNFELMQPGSARPDHVVVRRFEQLCRLLAQHPGELPVGSFGGLSVGADPLPWPKASLASGMRRYAEQIYRRLA